jgi:hypothetical protein
VAGDAQVKGILSQLVRKDQPPPEKCDVKACANDPKPPRVTLPEPEPDGDVPDTDLFALESPL